MMKRAPPKVVRRQQTCVRAQAHTFVGHRDHTSMCLSWVKTPEYEEDSHIQLLPLKSGGYSKCQAWRQDKYRQLYSVASRGPQESAIVPGQIESKEKGGHAVFRTDTIDNKSNIVPWYYEYLDGKKGDKVRDARIVTLIAGKEYCLAVIKGTIYTTAKTQGDSKQIWTVTSLEKKDMESSDESSSEGEGGDDLDDQEKKRKYEDTDSDSAEPPVKRHKIVLEN